MSATRRTIVPDRSQVWIDGSSSVHPIRASATGLDGWIELDDSTGALCAGVVEIAVEHLSSGNALVDRETRRRIDARRFPVIRGAVSSVTGDPQHPAVEGRIDFRGESCEVTGELTVERTGTTVVVEGRQTFDVRDWSLKPPRLGLLRVHPDIEVRVHIEAEGG